MTADHRSVSVVIPVYNNEVSLAELVERLVATLEASGRDHEIVLVDDGSADGSWRLISEASARHSAVVGLRLSRNFGQHPAIRAGFERARGDLTILMDADLQDRPESIPTLIEALGPDDDAVFTTWESGDPELKERLTSRLFHGVYSKMVAVDLPRNVGTLRLITDRFRDAVLDYPESGAVYGPLMAQMGFNAAWVGVTRDQAQGRRSSYSLRRRFALAVNTLWSYSDIPYRAVSWLGSVLVAISLVYFVIVGAQYAINGPQVSSGLTLVIMIQLLLSGAVLVGLGVLGAYVFRVFREVLRRPHTHVARDIGAGLSGDHNGGDQ